MNSVRSKEIPESQTELEPHRDERQIRLDTDRSFVLYPVGDAPSYPNLASHPFMLVLQATLRLMSDLHVKRSSTNSSFKFSGDTPV